MHLQIEKAIVELFSGFTFHRLTNQVCQFVCVLAASWNSNCAGPIVVQEAQLVCQALKMIRSKIVCIFDDNAVSWCYRTYTVYLLLFNLYKIIK